MIKQKSFHIFKTIIVSLDKNIVEVLINNRKMKFKTIGISLLMVSLLALPIFAGEDLPLLEEQIPKVIKKYVAKHFPTQQILVVVKDVEFGRLNYKKVKYNVELEGDVKLEFDKGKRIRKIECDSGLPNSVISEKVMIYISKHYASSKITEWERYGIIQKLKLDNGMCLHFDRKGKFVRIRK